MPAFESEACFSDQFKMTTGGNCSLLHCHNVSTLATECQQPEPALQHSSAGHSIAHALIGLFDDGLLGHFKSFVCVPAEPVGNPFRIRVFELRIAARVEIRDIVDHHPEKRNPPQRAGQRNGSEISTWEHALISSPCWQRPGSRFPRYWWPLCLRSVVSKLKVLRLPPS